jgi:hypothetical protein
MLLFYVNRLVGARPVNRVLAVGAVIAVPVIGYRRYVLAVPAEEDTYGFR